MRSFLRFSILIGGAFLLSPIGVLIFNPAESPINSLMHWVFVITMAGIWGWNFDKIFPAEKKKD